MFTVIVIILVGVGLFFAGRNYERHHPTTAEEAASNAKVAEWFRNLFKRK